MLWIARRDRITSLSAFLKFLKEKRHVSGNCVRNFTSNEPDRVVHRPEGEQRQRVDLHHEEHENDVENDADETDDQLGVQEEHSFVLPRRIRSQFRRVQHVLDCRVGHHRDEDRVLKAEYELDRSALGQRRLIGVGDEEVVEKAEDAEQPRDSDVKHVADHGTPLHLEVSRIFDDFHRDSSKMSYVVDSILRQPVKGLEEQQNREQRDELWIEVVPENGECEAGLGQRIPEPLHQMLELSSTKRSEENLRAKLEITEASSLHQLTFRISFPNINTNIRD
jgi:hypothetical protein